MGSTTREGQALDGGGCARGPSAGVVGPQLPEGSRVRAHV
jgi:hypothetical protein